MVGKHDHEDVLDRGQGWFFGQFGREFFLRRRSGRFGRCGFQGNFGSRRRRFGHDNRFSRFRCRFRRRFRGRRWFGFGVEDDRGDAGALRRGASQATEQDAKTEHGQYRDRGAARLGHVAPLGRVLFLLLRGRSHHSGLPGSVVARRLDYREPFGDRRRNRPAPLATLEAVALVRLEAGTAAVAARGVPAALVIRGDRHCGGVSLRRITELSPNCEHSRLTLFSQHRNISRLHH